MKKLLTILFALAAILTACNGKTQTSNAQKEKPAKVLVAYFSCTGHTEKAAKTIAQLTNADLFAITPAKAYTVADLDWRNDKSRSSIEMNDPTSRPALAEHKSNVKVYDIIYLGYPIWWGVCPRIINTFLDTYNLKGKKVIPFATSGSSSITQSETTLHKQYKDITWGKGLLMNNASQQEIKEWLNQNK